MQKGRKVELKDPAMYRGINKNIRKNAGQPNNHGSTMDVKKQKNIKTNMTAFVHRKVKEVIGKIKKNTGRNISDEQEKRLKIN